MTVLHGFTRTGRARPTVICLHSSGGSGAQWNALAARLGDGVEVLAPDLCGHGAGPGWHGAPADIVAADTARIARLAAAAGGAVHLVGHSYGGAIALRVALLHAGCVSSAAVYEPAALRVLFDDEPGHPAAVEVADVAAAMLRGLDADDQEAAAAPFIDYWSGMPQWARMSPDRRAAVARRMAAVYAHFVALANDRLRLRDYAAIAVPVQYLTGQATRASARRITALLEPALPFAESHTLEGMGHLGPITHADVVAQAIARFVGRQIAVRAAPVRAAA